MTQREHLTTEQLSAYLDKQLTPQEQAFFDAHLQSCQRCQHVLAELRGTKALLRAMPEPSLPRSFTLPASILQEPAPRPQPLPLPAQQRRVPRYMLQRTVRAVSTLAAVIAVIFILSGVLSGFHLGGAASMSAGTVANSGNVAPSASTSTFGRDLTQAPHAVHGTAATKEPSNGATAKPSAASTPVPTPAPTSTTDGTNQVVPPTPPTLPPFLDIGQPSGRLLLGAFLLLLSIAGLIATRRRRRTVI